MNWSASAPSNIALIKYMGKVDHQHNVPTNASISYTLNSLQTTVELSLLPAASKDQWLPFEGDPLHLSSKAQQRFLAHLQWLKDKFNFTGSFIVRSKNNFPLGCGLASSASSFAALTQCAVKALTELTEQNPLSVVEQATLSQAGSGSSCRSFFSPWAKWDKTGVYPINIPYDKLHHQVIVIDDQEKAISSSEAHRRVITSPLFNGRPQRAEQRLSQLVTALSAHAWEKAFHLCWDEFQDMHQLFITSEPAFSYFNARCHTVLNALEKLWQTTGHGPLVTMDAGPNIHLLYQAQDQGLADEFYQKHLEGIFRVI